MEASRRSCVCGLSRTCRRRLELVAVRELRPLIERAVASPRFSGSRLELELLPALRVEPRLAGLLAAVEIALNVETAKTILMGLVRAVFLIELVNDMVTSTKFEIRWSPRLQADPRGCEFDECCAIFERLLSSLASRLQDATVIETLGRFHLFNRLPYELPIDYIARTTPIHRADNMVWIWDDPEIAHTLLLRERIRDPNTVGDLVTLFVRAAKKTQVKTYLTDRALTGTSKTNREKRWEAHPDGVQFAFRSDCLKIEHKLMSQICHFNGFPVDVRTALASANSIVTMELPARCPITRDTLDLAALRATLGHPEWGRSQFQVGHLNPLKGPGAGPEFGHTPANIAWISADGNRVQGSLSYAETMALLNRIQTNFEQYPPQ